MTSAIYTIMDDDSGKYATGPKIQGKPVEWREETGGEEQMWELILTGDTSRWQETKVKNRISEYFAWCKKPADEGYKVEVSVSSRYWYVRCKMDDSNDDSTTGFIQADDNKKSEMYWQSPSDDSIVTLGPTKSIFVFTKQ